MTRISKGITMALLLSIAIIVSACNNQDQGAANANRLDEENTTNVSDHSHNNNQEGLNNPDVIPSEIGDKTSTTNKDGTTYSGMGNSIYGSIGSSGIHEGGVSSYFESILEGQGITGVKVFVIDDSVVLARNKEETTSHRYDNIQNDLLSGNEGMSGKGEPEGVKDGKEESLDNLEQAKKEVNDMFNGNVKILTVTNPGAVDLIESIKDNIMASSYQDASKEVLQLLQMAE
ncbi:hypothetical protein KK120_19190 [Virgibacillus dakarensis]|uniref:hypothetical protein n=1 Tax=Virgibacillus dakarensis TaxID=1917889 RepID=UPI000B44852D|nr:hypothetical protein [Virgibacillus dakarensis]MBT2217932.1 hypothetical protein [Virgibacillus dakarensis]